MMRNCLIHPSGAKYRTGECITCRHDYQREYLQSKRDGTFTPKPVTQRAPFCVWPKRAPRPRPSAPLVASKRKPNPFLTCNHCGHECANGRELVAHKRIHSDVELPEETRSLMPSFQARTMEGV